MASFRDEQIALLTASGWLSCASVAQAVAEAGLPAPTADFLVDRFSAQNWKTAELKVLALREHFGTARFAAETVFGLVLVPDPTKLDTRRPMSPAVRKDQLGRATGDVFDDRLAAGVLGVRPGADWTAVATVTGPYGVSLGSYYDVAGGSAEAFIVDGNDTRTLMIRQVWGARVLQSGSKLPDCGANEHWTFTLFPGEALIDGEAESGTVLKSKVRFRLGKPDRGIGPVRVAPAISIP